MKYLVASLSIMTVMGGMAWKLGGQQVASAKLQDVSLVERSERSLPGPANALAGIRIRLSPSDYSDDISTTEAKIPPITLAAE